MSDAFHITYAAHTATCTFLMDADGFCRRIVPVSGSSRSLPAKNATRVAARCVGAQYVASLDPSVTGMLAEMPRVGSAMLFARIDERGRVSLVRTGVVTRFDHHRAEDPFTDVPVSAVESLSVETSAPVIPPSTTSPRFSRDKVSERRPVTPPQPLRPEELKAKDRRTQPFGVSGADLYARTDDHHAIDRAALREAERARGRKTEPDADSIDVILDDDATLERSSGWLSQPPASEPRNTPRPAPMSAAPHAPTLRAPTALVTAPDDELDPYAAPRSAALPRPAAPPPPRMRSERVPRGPQPISYPQLDKVGGRRER